MKAVGTPAAAASEVGRDEPGGRGARVLRRLRQEGLGAQGRRVAWGYFHRRFKRAQYRLGRNGGAESSEVSLFGRPFETQLGRPGLSEELRLYAAHEPEASRAYSDLIRPGDHILDIGANLGYWALLARAAGAGRVVALEPVAALRELLARNVAQAAAREIEVLPFALSDRAGDTEFYESSVPNWGSLLRRTELQPLRVTTVMCKRLDDLLEDLVRFDFHVLRMDLEGAELKVLEGGRRVLERLRPALFIEFHPSLVGWSAVRGAMGALQHLGYGRAVLIHRTWDQPWIPGWARRRRCFRGSLKELIERIESPKDDLTRATFSLLTRAV